jgi:hypothetical protein
LFLGGRCDFLGVDFHRKIQILQRWIMTKP